VIAAYRDPVIAGHGHDLRGDRAPPFGRHPGRIVISGFVAQDNREIRVSHGSCLELRLAHDGRASSPRAIALTLSHR
jgi:hypothetical protein